MPKEVFATNTVKVDSHKYNNFIVNGAAQNILLMLNINYLESITSVKVKATQATTIDGVEINFTVTKAELIGVGTDDTGEKICGAFRK